MLVFNPKLYAGGCLLFLMAACSTLPVAPEAGYSRTARLHLYQLQQWSFEGRLALTGKNDSWSANIIWEHSPDEEKIKLSGPLGQGTVVINLTGDFVTVNQGDGNVQSSTQPEEFINQQLGMFVPVQSMRYWVIGLPEPSSSFKEIHDGFKQAGWLNEYKQMQLANNEIMPRKMTVMNAQVKLKLIIDKWILDETKAK
ncbi:Outer-membrane lipoprotein LolB [Candidatus Methylobacter favarea]|uniref:Outer-membrane lipoprotein LolB n=1 Tax=Candidatus Methylobacter favarea TaxID=2707345 RepID=A0A8S0WYI5_9GAMM|nr:lipoprotein insertase outer membrane protein LolB [Candidatus Methylobacter favarea]CAA9889573.1 Outer-membrane lipoprotein LolB [Candidatus Methylobacter favarea]